MATVLAGLFPPKGTALEWNTRLNWQPIPIFSEPLDEDTVNITYTFFLLHLSINFTNQKQFIILFIYI